MRVCVVISCFYCVCVISCFHMGVRERRLRRRGKMRNVEDDEKRWGWREMRRRKCRRIWCGVMWKNEEWCGKMAELRWTGKMRSCGAQSCCKPWRGDWLMFSFVMHENGNDICIYNTVLPFLAWHCWITNCSHILQIHMWYLYNNFKNHLYWSVHSLISLLMLSFPDFLAQNQNNCKGVIRKSLYNKIN